MLQLVGLWCAGQPTVGVIGQVDDIAVWSRALGPPEALRVFTEGIRESDPDLSLFYDFNEGMGAYARNKGRAGAHYDLVLGSRFCSEGCTGNAVLYNFATLLLPVCHLYSQGQKLILAKYQKNLFLLQKLRL